MTLLKSKFLQKRKLIDIVDRFTCSAVVLNCNTRGKNGRRVFIQELFVSKMCQKPESERYKRVRAFDTNNE